MKTKFLASVIFILVFIALLSTCTTTPQNNDNVPPTILINSPSKDEYYYSSLNIDIEVNEVYEKGKSISQLDRAIVKIVSYHDGSTIYSKEFKMSGYQYEIKDSVSLPSTYSSCTMFVEVYDSNGNRAEESINFYISGAPFFYVFITSPSWILITNVGEIELMGEVKISPEYYGDISNVYIMISNSSGYFSNSLGSLRNFYFYTNLRNPEENNWIYVYALSTSNYWTNSWIYYIYDTNKPFVDIIDPLHSQTIPQYYDVIVTNYDNYDGSYVPYYSLMVVDRYGNTNVYSPYDFYPLKYRVIFNPGTNEIIAYAKDTAGNESFTNIRVFVDNSIPNVIVSNYSPSYVGLSNYFTTYGYCIVADGSIITNIKVLVLTNSILAYSTNLGASSSNVLFSVLHPVFMGTNLIGVVAYANNGKVSTTNYYTVIADYMKPFVNFILTNDEFVSSGTDEYFYLVLEVGDTNYSWGGVVYIYVTNYPSGSSYYTSFWTSSGITTNTILINLIRGRNDITVFCIDYFGNSSSTNLTNIYFFDNAVYVAPDGNDANRGTIYDPIRTLQIGLNKVSLLGARNLRLKQGVYTPGSGLNSSGVGVVLSNSINIFGGYDSSYLSIVGRSVLDGQNLLDHVVLITNSTNTIELVNLEIVGGSNKNASYPNNHGGGILIANLSNLLIMDNLIIRNNYSPFGGGIGVVNSSNTLLLKPPIEVYNNISSNGGGIVFSSSTNNLVTVGAVYVYSNRSIYGGGISIIDSSVHLDNVNISLNSSEFGGGIFITNSRNNQIDVSVYRNIATNSGGGIYLVSSFSNTLGGNIYSNGAISGNGGGIYLIYSTNNIIDANVYGNKLSSIGYGGGIYLTYSYKNVISGSVYNNSAGWLCGGIYLNYSSSNVIYANVYSNYGNDSGGGIYLNFSLNNLIAGDIYYNFATNGGGIYLRSSTNNTVQSRVYSNSSYDSGGGVYLSISSSNVIAGDVFNNSSTTIGFGGGIRLDYSEYNVLLGNVYGNYATWGGGISFNSSSNNMVSNNIFNNRAGWSGGGIIILQSVSNNFVYAKVFSNTANYGGGIAIEKTTNETIVVNVYNNSALREGGGVHIETSSNISVLGKILSNISFDVGGGVNIRGNSYFILSANVSYNVSSNRGGGIHLTNCYGVLSNMYFTNNVSSNLGGAVYIQGFGDTILVNSVFVGNWSKNHGGAIYGVNTTNLTIQSNVFTNNYSSSTNTVITIASSISNLGSPFGSLKFITNIFSGYGANSCAIWEEDLVYTNTLFNNDIKNHTIVDNVFYTNTFTYLYRDINTNTSLPKLPGYIYSNELNSLNFGSSSRHDANPSGGNVGY